MKSGIVSVNGRSNAGKSTLINVLVGEKVSIVSPKPQTTRDCIMGVLTTDEYQIVFEDTPGFYKARTQLNKTMQRSARKATEDVDLVLFVMDVHAGIVDDDIDLLKTCLNRDVPVVVVVSKTDIMPENLLIEVLSKLNEVEGISDIIPVSARKGRNTKELIKVILNYMPERDEKVVSEDIISDKSDKFMISEIMREKILLEYDKEIPHGVAIVINEFREEKGVFDINLDIICEKLNHKAIIIGKQGSAIKKVSSFAREAMEKYLGKKVFLTTYVKVEENWRDNINLLSQYGYGEKNK